MKAKILFTWIAMLFMMTASANLFAQHTNPEPIEYSGTSTQFAVMINNARHYRMAVLTAQELQVEKKGYQFEIVVTGKLVKELAEDESLLETVKKAAELGVKTVLCKKAMDFLGVKKEDLDERIEITPNAWIYMFELRDKGYNVIEAG